MVLQWGIRISCIGKRGHWKNEQMNHMACSGRENGRDWVLQCWFSTETQENDYCYLICYTMICKHGATPTGLIIMIFKHQTDVYFLISSSISGSKNDWEPSIC